MFLFWELFEPALVMQRTLKLGCVPQALARRSTKTDDVGRTVFGLQCRALNKQPYIMHDCFNTTLVIQRAFELLCLSCALARWFTKTDDICSIFVGEVPALDEHAHSHVSPSRLRVMFVCDDQILLLCISTSVCFSESANPVQSDDSGMETHFYERTLIKAPEDPENYTCLCWRNRSCQTSGRSREDRWGTGRGSLEHAQEASTNTSQAKWNRCDSHGNLWEFGVGFRTIKIYTLFHLAFWAHASTDHSRIISLFLELLVKFTRNLTYGIWLKPAVPFEQVQS